MKLYKIIEEILDNEREYLLRGNYEKLQEIATQKAAVNERFRALGINKNQEAIDMIKQKSIRNDALLQSAARGIRAAMMRINDVTESNFQSYSKEGNRIPLLTANRIRQKL